MTKNVLDEIIREQRDTSLTDRYLEQYGLTEEYINLPNVNLYCKAVALGKNSIVKQKDKDYCKQFAMFWITTKGVITKKSKKRMFAMIKYYNNKEQNLALRNARLERKKNRKLMGTQAEKC